MKQIDLTNVQEATDFQRIPAGAYICQITAAEDFPEKEYIKITYDIAEGEHKNHYSDLRKDHSDWEWAGAYVKSYKPKALPMFKRFCSAVSKSNGSYVFDGKINPDEKTLVGKKIGLVFREEEYWGNDGEKKTRLSVSKEFPISDLASQKVPPMKKLKDDDAAPATSSGSDDGFINVPEGIDSELPFA